MCAVIILETLPAAPTCLTSPAPHFHLISTSFPPHSALQPRHLPSILKPLLLLCVLVVLGWLVVHAPFAALLSEDWVNTQVRGMGWHGGLLFLGAGALATALAFPRQIVAMLAGYAFGFAAGTVLAILAALLGCMLAFTVARGLGRVPLQSRFGPRIRKLDTFLGQHPFSMALALRLLPLGSNALISLLAGLSSVRGLPFFAGSAVGYLPQSLIFALAGSGISVDPTLRLSLATVLLLASGLIGMLLYRRHTAGCVD